MVKAVASFGPSAALDGRYFRHPVRHARSGWRLRAGAGAWTIYRFGSQIRRGYIAGGYNISVRERGCNQRHRLQLELVGGATVCHRRAVGHGWWKTYFCQDVGTSSAEWFLDIIRVGCGADDREACVVNAYLLAQPPRPVKCKKWPRAFCLTFRMVGALRSSSFPFLKPLESVRKNGVGVDEAIPMEEDHFPIWNHFLNLVSNSSVLMTPATNSPCSNIRLCP